MSEQNINKDIGHSNNLDDKASKNKILPDDVNSDKNYQNTNQEQNTSNDTNSNTEDSEIISPVTNGCKKDTDIQESTQGRKIGSNNESEMVQDTNRNPDDNL